MMVIDTTSRFARAAGNLRENFDLFKISPNCGDGA
jgi:hypothetical protein